MSKRTALRPRQSWRRKPRRGFWRISPANGYHRIENDRLNRMNTKTPDANDRFAELWRQYGRGVLGLLILVLVVHDIFGTHGFLAMRRAQAEINTVRTNLSRLNLENAELAERVHDLKS